MKKPVHTLAVEGKAGQKQQALTVEDGVVPAPVAPGLKVNQNPNWFSRLLFLFVDPIVSYGYRNTLQTSDLYKPTLVNTKPLYERFMHVWSAQRKRPVPDIKRAVLAGCTWGLVYTGMLYAVSLACQLVGPLMLQQIVGGLSCYAVQQANPAVPCPTRSYLYMYVIGLCLAPLVQSLAENWMQFELNLIGTRMRNGLMAAIFRKCLVLSNSALQSESTGRIVTLMSNDAQKVQDAMLAIHVLWGAPVLIVVILILLYLQVGWATFVGLGVMIVFAPISAKVSQRLLAIRRNILKWTDKRVGLMSEVINGMQMIKFYAWEEPFRKEIMAARANEAQLLKDSTWWMALFGMLLFSAPVMVAVFCFGAYSLAGQPLSTAGAYTALALFNLLRFPLAFLPFLITMLVNAMVALRRIQNFLEKGETTAVVDTESVEPGAIKVTDSEFSWDEAAEKATLRDINFECKPGTLTMVVGNVGCGKSSVLAGLIGQIERRKGTVAVGGKVAYVAQTAWITNEIVQENVLLGEEFDAERYQMAVEVAQLVPDLEILPNGDRTEIGDRGVTLSGGQKQRVSIARAVYADADVYLMDDPLSAVDSHVGRALFEECITGVLAGKTIVLVTNALQFLPHADNIVWLEDGAIRGQGSYTQLVEQGLNIAELVHVDDEVKQAKANEDAKELHAAEAEGRPVVKQVDVHGVVGAPDGRGSTDGSSSSTSADATAALDDDVAINGDVAKRRAVLKAEAATMGRWQSHGKPSAALSLTRVMNETNRNLTGVEAREEGNVSSKVLKTYTKAAGGTWIVVLIAFLFVCEQGARVFTDTWVGIWFGNQFNQSVAFYLGLYVLLSVLYALATFLRSLRFLYSLVNAAISLHNQLLEHVMRLPKAFFDTNPAGRILNRFSRDTEVMDSVLSQSLIQFAGSVATYIAILIVISVATKWFAIAIIPMTVFYFFLQRYYIPTARELQRIESVSRSPIYSKFSEALAGVATIRAYRKEAYFTDMSDELMQSNAYAYVSQKAAASWLAMRLDFVGLIILTLAGVLCIQGTISPGLAGLCLTYALDLTRFLKQGTAMASKSESDFNSAERIVQYLQPEPEASPDTKPEVAKSLPPNWPASGAVSVRDVKMRYRPEMPLVLKGVTFELGAGEKVGLVGRTGSGKSSLFQVLFRMVEPTSGVIAIDGVDITTVGLHLLRSKMSVIPQDPFMFSGTVRYNMDPFSEHTDAELWEVLGAVGLKPTISELELKLEAPVTDNGSNFSQGQKQLFCMARAMLRHSRILMLDEATASVDPETDALIQLAIRSVFHDCTVLTIAHRLNTIMDSDRVLVMDNGVVAEDDTPFSLLQRDAGQFTSMVQQTGASSSAYLKEVARTASKSRNMMVQHVDSFTDRRWGSGGGSGDGGGGAVSATMAPSTAHAVLRTPSQLGVPRELTVQEDPNTTFASAPTNLNREITLMRQNMASGDLDLNPLASLGIVREGSAEGSTSSGALGAAISGAVNAIARVSRRSIGSLDVTAGRRSTGSLDVSNGDKPSSPRV